MFHVSRETSVFDQIDFWTNKNSRAKGEGERVVAIFEEDKHNPDFQMSVLIN